MNNKIIGLISICLILISCNSVKQISKNNSTKILFKNINEDVEEFDGCEVTVYRSLNTDSLLNGKYQICYKKRKTIFANFLDGKLNGLVETYEKRELIHICEYKDGLKNGLQVNYYKSYSSNEKKETVHKTITSYRNGLINGIQKWYFDNVLTITQAYSNGIQEGKSYFFDNKGDTLDIMTFSPIKPLEGKYRVVNHKEYDDSYPFRGSIEVISKNETINELSLFLSVDPGVDNCCREKLKGAYLFLTISGDFVFCFNASSSIPDDVFKLD
ncbi:hypothetical protein NBRC110019_25290 [Neptunitalea chrysea]|uniref:Lipoprotein n=1 Tax=Neptunitalea chrysea TaxID=1647581 RepID=A0A9W6B984_9FLAO|nr:hypothetical protein [Neptunitalea chrysea]GLB53488.1 hypothetical protein NBRC110019_25290 [Neptunitalea chrysea]